MSDVEIKELSEEEKKINAEKAEMIIAGMKKQKSVNVENDILILREQNENIIKVLNQIVKFLEKKLGE